MGVEVCSPDRSRWPTFAHSQASAVALKERRPTHCIFARLSHCTCGWSTGSHTQLTVTVLAVACALRCALAPCRWVVARLAPPGPYLTRSRSLQLGSLTPGRFGLGQGGQFEGVLRAHARPHAHRLLQRLARRVALLVARVCVCGVACCLVRTYHILYVLVDTMPVLCD